MYDSRDTSHNQLSHSRRIPDAIWSPIVAGLLLLAAGGIGLAFGEPWLFPSLGPSAYMQVATPRQRSANLYCTFVGHMAGMLSGVIAVLVTGSSAAPPVVADAVLTPTRLYAAVIALALTVLTGLLLRALHPPAAATTLLFALGSLGTTAHGITTLVVGVAIIAVLGETARLVRLGEKPGWHSIAPHRGRDD